jgi:hypothetical protein
MLTFDDCLALVRSGDVKINLHTQGIKLVILKDSGNANEILATMRDHLKELVEMLATNDTRVCMSPDAHRASYQWWGDQVYTCDDCAAVYGLLNGMLICHWPQQQRMWIAGT